MPTYALDLPGHGGSSKDVGSGDASALIAAVTDFMAAQRSRARTSSAIRWAARWRWAWRGPTPSASPR